jgi:hypothetical protein
MTPRIRWTLIGSFVALGLLGLNHYAPLQPCSVVFDLALVTAVAGLLSLIKPLRWFSIGSRRAGLLVALSAASVGACALLWSVPVTRAASADVELDRVLPEYSVAEYHSVRVHASPARVYAAMHAMTLADIKVFGLLMELRALGGGQLRRVEAPPLPMLATLLRPGTGFIPLYDDGRGEVVFGLAGRFWSNAPQPALTREDFAAYRVAAAAKAVCSLRVVDLGGGWSRLTTETRGAGTDERGRRVFARYWRVIYPGSATLRRMMLNAIRDRAER